VDEARQALGEFIRTAHKNGIRCVRVVHGKGLGSPGKSPVLKSRVQRWLVQKHEVLAFMQARPVDGGAGAMLVLLQPVGVDGGDRRHSPPMLSVRVCPIRPRPGLHCSHRRHE